MANWDFCSECNSGIHCSSHCDCCPSTVETIRNYSIKELKLELKRRTKIKKNKKKYVSKRP